MFESSKFLSTRTQPKSSLFLEMGEVEWNMREEIVSLEATLKSRLKKKKTLSSSLKQLDTEIDQLSKSIDSRKIKVFIFSGSLGIFLTILFIQLHSRLVKFKRKKRNSKSHKISLKVFFFYPRTSEQIFCWEIPQIIRS